MFDDIAKTHVKLLQSAMPQVNLIQSLAASGMFQDILKTQVKLLPPATAQVNLIQSLAASGMFQDILKTQVKLLPPAMTQVNWFGALAAGGTLRDIIEMQAQLAAVARAAQSASAADTELGTTLSRSSQRFLFGNFVYCLVFSLEMLAYIKFSGESQIDSQIVSLLIFATGYGAHQMAKGAREVALRVFDSLYPPE
jgi:hypothetical protein